MIGYAISVFLCAALIVPQVSCKYNYKTCAKNWIKMGCRIDDDRDMTTLFDDRRNGQVQIDWSNLYGYIQDLACRCRAKALELKHRWFALENYGICFSGPGTITNFLKKHRLARPKSCTGALKHNKTIVSDKDGEICVGGYMRAYFYNIINPNAPVGSAEGEGEAEGEAVAACQKVSDVILIIDVSGSVGSDNFKRIQEFLQKLIDYFDFGNGKDKSRLGIVTFDDNVYLQLTWLDSEALNKGQIRDIINNLKYEGGSTATDKALKFVMNTIIKPFKRNNVPKTVFILTDGRCFNGANLLPVPSQQLRALGCKVITIGIGDDVDTDELEIMTGNKGNIFLYSTFKNLIDVAVKALNGIVGKACV